MAAVAGTTTTSADYRAFREWKDFFATDGSRTEQVITHVGASLEVNAADDDDLQRRSFPESGGYRAAGYEHVRGLDLVGRAPQLAAEAVELLSAPVLPPGRRTIILHPSQLYLQIHESCGHPTELDRVFGTEAAYAGTSFLTTDKLDSGFAYGSRAGDHRGRRHHARRAGHLRLGRRGRRRPVGPPGERGHLQRLSLQSRDRASHRPGQRWSDACRRLRTACRSSA